MGVCGTPATTIVSAPASLTSRQTDAREILYFLCNLRKRHPRPRTTCSRQCSAALDKFFALPISSGLMDCMSVGIVETPVRATSSIPAIPDSNLFPGHKKHLSSAKQNIPLGEKKT